MRRRRGCDAGRTGAEAVVDFIGVGVGVGRRPHALDGGGAVQFVGEVAPVAGVVFALIDEGGVHGGLDLIGASPALDAGAVAEGREAEAVALAYLGGAAARQIVGAGQGPEISGAAGAGRSRAFEMNAHAREGRGGGG
ncbi:hypothetical protein D3C80_1733790 [compost metagenome]